MNEVILKILATFRRFTVSQADPEIEVRSHVKEALIQHKETINFLEKYDKGEVSTPESVAKHRNLRSYLQSI